MEGRKKIIETTGWYVFIGGFALSIVLFTHWSGFFWKSILASLISAGTFWATYVLLRVAYLAFTEE